MCEFHSTFMVNGKKQLVPMSDRANNVRRNRTTACENRKYVAEHWSRDRTAYKQNPSENEKSDKVTSENVPLVTMEKEDMDFDEFVRRMRSGTLKISAMAFQDAMNIDLERLYRCSLHVYDNGRLVPFCAKYLTPYSTN